MKQVCKRMWVLLLVCVLLCGVTSCEQEDETIHVAWVQSNGDNIERIQNLADSDETRINSYLEQQNKEYRIQIEAIVWKNVESISDWTGQYDLVYGDASLLTFSPTILEEKFVNLQEELVNGKLQSLYTSMSEQYWESVKEGNGIYTTIRSVPNAIHGLWIMEPALQALGLSVPEELIGKPLDKWGDFFAEIYEKNGGVPFLSCPFHENNDQFPIGQGFVWEAHFHMVGMHIGISYDQPELGVQCIYESQYAETMNQVWQDYWEKGYVFMDEGLKSEAWRDNQLVIRSQSTYSLDPIQLTNLWTIYPLQESGYSSNWVSGIEKSKLLILKSTNDLDVIYQFMNDMASDLLLAQTVCSDGSGKRILNWTPLASNMYPIGMPTVTTGLTEPVEENSDKLKSYYENMKSSPVAGFMMDWTNVTEIQKRMYDMIFIENYQDIEGIHRFDRVSLAAGGSSYWDDYEESLDWFISDLYDAGMEELLEEANQQLKEFEGVQ